MADAFHGHHLHVSEGLLEELLAWGPGPGPRGERVGRWEALRFGEVWVRVGVEKANAHTVPPIAFPLGPAGAGVLEGEK